MWNHGTRCGFLLAFILWLAVGMIPTEGWTSTTDIRLSKKQTVYVPVYSNVFSGPRKRPLQLEATLAIRSTDPVASLRITSIDYYDTAGKLVRRYLKQSTATGAAGLDRCPHRGKGCQRRLWRQFHRPLGGRPDHQCPGHRVRHDRLHRRSGHIICQPGTGDPGGYAVTPYPLRTVENGASGSRHRPGSSTRAAPVPK